MHTINQLILCQELLSTLVDVPTHLIDHTHSHLEKLFDTFYPNLFHEINSKEDFFKSLQKIPTQGIFHFTDLFHINYMFLPIEENSQLLIVGPYLTEQPTESLCKHVIMHTPLSLSTLLPLQMYYTTLPVCQDSKIISALRIVFKHLYSPLTTLSYTHTICENETLSEIPTYSPNENQHFVMELLEKRYELENQLLLEIQQGNVESALAVHREFSNQIKGIVRWKDQIRNHKNLSYVANTLYRKAVERAAIHPIYIDLLSAKFSQRIESSNSLESLIKLRSEMVEAYCLLVKKHSLKHYSPSIRKAINYIQMNLSSDLTLSTIASAINISPNYLSNLFNKEIQQSLTDFIHQKRIDKAIHLLTTTDLPIQNIAFYVGYTDTSYFTKLFKKYAHQTPSDYKKNISLR